MAKTAYWCTTGHDHFRSIQHSRSLNTVTPQPPSLSTNWQLLDLELLAHPTTKLKIKQLLDLELPM
jgi:hypothetical protein